MKLIVAIKQVPARDSNVRVAADARWIDTADLSFEINEPDAYALETALQLKDKHGGEVVVLCAGPPGAATSIREALGKGADRGILVNCEHVESLDTLALARLLASAIADEKPDLILTGLQSDDLGLGQTGVVLSELLGIPHATIIMDVEVRAGRIRVKRELEDGWFQHLEMPVPALLTIQSGISRLRYATLLGIKKAKTKEIRTITAQPALAEAPVRLERVYVPEKKKQTRLIEGDARMAAEQLIEVLRNEVRAL